MGHPGAANGLDQGLGNDAVLDIQRQFAGPLMRGAGPHPMTEAADISDLF